ncbi:MAG: Smr/MutS family protein [Spirochaetia bacterium]
MSNNQNDFGKILNQWEHYKEKKPSEKKTQISDMMQSWLDSNSVPDKDSLQPKAENKPKIKNLVQMTPQDTLDLHGMTVPEAEATTNSFLQASANKGYIKVLIIHGKGNHSGGEAVLKKHIRKYIQDHPLCGRTGEPGRKEGGSGALWVILRYRSR